MEKFKVYERQPRPVVVQPKRRPVVPMDNAEPQTTGFQSELDQQPEHPVTIELVEKKTVQFAALTIDAAKKLNPELDISHNQLRELFDITREYFGASQEVTDYLIRESQRFSAELRSVEGFVGTFGLGYPFYALTPEGNPVEAPEISNFLGITQELVNADAKRNPEGWMCAACQAVNNLPDLKSQCKPCDLVALKPRDVFKALPDLDIIVVVDEPTEETERLIEDIANKMGYRQSDTDIAEAINRTRATLEDIKEGREPQEKFPLDIHVWSKQAFLECTQLAAEGYSNVEILGRSLHMQWENNPINFWYDFVLSMTEIDIVENEFHERVKSGRKQLKETLGVDQIVRKLQNASPRVARLLETQTIRDILVKKLESW